MKKGIVITISVIIIISSLLTIISMYSETVKKHNMDITKTMPLMNSKNIFDDFAFDWEENDGMNILVEENESKVYISFIDYSPQEYSLLSDLEKFYENEYVNHSGANISVDVPSGPWIIFSNGLSYIHSEEDESNHTVFVSENTNLEKYVINISVAADRNETYEWDWPGAGDVYIELNYADNNGSIVQSGYLNKSRENYYYFWYQGEPRPEVKLFFGEDGALKVIRDGDISIGISITAIMSEVENLNAWHNIHMNYSKGSIVKQSTIPAKFEKI